MRNIYININNINWYLQSKNDQDRERVVQSVVIDETNAWWNCLLEVRPCSLHSWWETRICGPCFVCYIDWFLACLYGQKNEVVNLFPGLHHFAPQGLLLKIFPHVKNDSYSFSPSRKNFGPWHIIFLMYQKISSFISCVCELFFLWMSITQRPFLTCISKW